MTNDNCQVYRASVAAIIVDDQGRFLLTKLAWAKEQWDFVKGGVDRGETDIQALEREIGEELGMDFRFEIMEKSELQIVYDWESEMQKRSGYRGQARISYWVRYLGGEITLEEAELSDYRWVDEDEVELLLMKNHFSPLAVEMLMKEYKRICKG